MFRRKNQKPSEVLSKHIEGRSGPFDLDDLMTNDKAPHDLVIAPLIQINEKYRTKEYRIGLTNPASFDEIARLAEELRLVGL